MCDRRLELDAVEKLIWPLMELAQWNRSARSGSALPEAAAEEATVTKRATRRTSVAPAAAEVAEAPGAARRRQSIAPAQTPAAAAAPAGGAAPTTAVSMRGRRRRSSVSPIPDSITKEVRTVTCLDRLRACLELSHQGCNQCPHMCSREPSPAGYLHKFRSSALPTKLSVHRYWMPVTCYLGGGAHASKQQHDLEAAHVQDGGRAMRGARRVPAASVTALSLGPPQVQTAQCTATSLIRCLTLCR